MSLVRICNRCGDIITGDEKSIHMTIEKRTYPLAKRLELIGKYDLCEECYALIDGVLTNKAKGGVRSTELDEIVIPLGELGELLQETVI